MHNTRRRKGKLSLPENWDDGPLIPLAPTIVRNTLQVMNDVQSSLKVTWLRFSVMMHCSAIHGLRCVISCLILLI